MTSRIPLLVAVVGALLVGGATTGSTRASWTDQATLAAASITSGTMALSSIAAPTGLTVARGASGTTVVTLSDTSSAGAKNLVQRITPTVGTALPAGVTAALRTRTGTTCNAAAQGPVSTTPGGSVTACLVVTVAASTTATNATVTVSVAGRQLRGGSPVGWSAVPSTLSVPVSIPVATPSAPTNFRCTSAKKDDVSLAWSAVSGATAYRVYRRNGSAPNYTYPSFSQVTGTSATNLDRTMWSADKNDTITLVLRAVNSAGESGDSSPVTVTFQGNDNCTPLSP